MGRGGLGATVGTSSTWRVMSSCGLTSKRTGAWPRSSITSGTVPWVRATWCRSGVMPSWVPSSATTAPEGDDVTVSVMVAASWARALWGAPAHNAAVKATAAQHCVLTLKCPRMAAT